MKKTFYLCLLLACFSCVTNPDKGFNQDGTTKEITKTFKEYGFSITAPCDLEDLTSKSKDLNGGSIVAYYAGFENLGDTINATGYSVVVHEIPSSFEDYTEEQMNDVMDQVKNSGFTNVEKVLFSDNKYIGYVGDIYKDGSMNRVVEFNKDKYLITLMVGANTDLDQKFEKFTSSFKTIDQD